MKVPWKKILGWIGKTLLRAAAEKANAPKGTP